MLSALLVLGGTSTIVEKNIMNVQEAREIAKGMGVSPGKMKKVELIRSIQVKEGNFPCFQAATHNCDQMDCRWRNDCLATH
jgi:hypothetical protein